eukprot:g8276.t1
MIESKNSFQPTHCNVGSLSSEDFLERADASCQNHEAPLASPVIPNGYARYTQQLLDAGICTRDQLRLVPVLESWHSCRHPHSLTRAPLTLEEVRRSRNVTELGNISLLECARRADGAAAIVLASNRFLARKLGDGRAARRRVEEEEEEEFGFLKKYPVLLGGGEASGPLYPPEKIDDAGAVVSSSGTDACDFAYEAASLAPEDIDFFGLYDCFPVCFLKALAASGVVRDEREAGPFLEELYEEFKTSVGQGGDRDTHYAEFCRRFPINTHGGLLCFGAPWEVPAAFNVVEAVRQLTAIPSTATGFGEESRCRRALVYGNGGIFSASAVAILGVR